MISASAIKSKTKLPEYIALVLGDIGQIEDFAAKSKLIDTSTPSNALIPNNFIYTKDDCSGALQLKNDKF